MPAMRVILNPYARRGAAATLKPRVLETLRTHGLEFDLVETSGPGDAVRLAREACDRGYSALVVVGGDGTLHEAVNGIQQAGAGPDDVTLGIVPTGSGNDFIKALDLPPDDLTTACARIARGHTRVVDIGVLKRLVTQDGAPTDEETRARYFVNALGIGFDALVALETYKITWLTGLPLYLIAVIRALALRYDTPHMEIELDGQRISQSTTLVAIGNGRCQAGGFWLTPHAEVDDGQFDLAIARRLSRWGILRLLPEAMQGTHVDKEPVTMARARRVAIRTASPLPVQADGEILATAATYLETEVAPRRLRVFA